ncbi:hypothetical protein BCV23_25430, partial [Vibrio lentus]
VPVFNKEKYIKACLESLLNQTYSNIEIVLIDDGSWDNSKNICKSYADKHDIIIYKSIKNGGVGLARNKGFELCSGIYCVFVDADDCIKNNFIEKLHSSIKQQKSDLSVCGIEEFQDHERSTYYTYLDANPIISHKKLLASASVLVHSCGNKIFKTEVIKSYGIAFSEEYHTCEDMNFVIKYLTCINIISVVNEALYLYIKNPDSVTSEELSCNKMVSNIYNTINICDDALLFILSNSIDSKKTILLKNKLKREYYRVGVALQNVYVKEREIKLDWLVRTLSSVTLRRYGASKLIKMHIRMILLVIFSPIVRLYLKWCN